MGCLRYIRSEVRCPDRSFFFFLPLLLVLRFLPFPLLFLVALTLLFSSLPSALASLNLLALASLRRRAAGRKAKKGVQQGVCLFEAKTGEQEPTVAFFPVMLLSSYSESPAKMCILLCRAERKPVRPNEPLPSVPPLPSTSREHGCPFLNVF